MQLGPCRGGVAARSVIGEKETSKNQVRVKRPGDELIQGSERPPYGYDACPGALRQGSACVGVGALEYFFKVFISHSSLLGRGDREKDGRFHWDLPLITRRAKFHFRSFYLFGIGEGAPRGGGILQRGGSKPTKFCSSRKLKNKTNENYWNFVLGVKHVWFHFRSSPRFP